MGTIRVEPEPPTKATPCRQCDGTNHLLHGYIYDDDFAHGIYFVEWCDGEHSKREAFLTVGLGTFGDDTDASDRMAFCIEWRADGMALAEEPARDRPDLLGTFVPREQALQIENIDHLWHVADHIVVDDARLAHVRSWLDRRA